MVHKEIALASDAMFVVGTAGLPMDIFTAAIFWIAKIYHTSAILSEIFDVAVINQATSTLFSFSCASLPRLVILTKHTNCCDLRDRIYAILSLFPADVSEGLIPNYSKTADEIFKDAVLRYINTRHRLSLLSLCRFHHPASTLPLPSWVFDFSIPFS
jgi:hypothetical protein